MYRRIACGCFVLALLALAFAMADTTKPASLTANLKAGQVQLKSAGALAFGPDGVLFVGDSAGAAVVEIDTGDRSPAHGAAKVDVEGIDVKIAAMAGVATEQIAINDVKVNPISRNIYLSVSRGKGPDAAPLIVRVDAAGNVTNVSLDNIRHASVSLSDQPAANPGARQDPRMMTITDMSYVNGNLLVAGLSNEEWSSALRSIPVPFKNAEPGATLQIWHSSHGRYETQSPVRTFVPYTIAGQPYILAAYTCTPLVKIPAGSLKPGEKVKGVTIADLGAGNQPLDMVPYKKDGHDFILIANSSRGLVKLKADALESYAAIDSPTKVDGPAGVPYDKLDLKNVQQLAAFDAANAVVLVGKPGPMNLQSIALP
ncbi:MAG TPA: hypothetical protein VKB88_39590 [Bryobacteraceae bacterium]|nr:hypothetical protein [Bryobacteraceae bacterium]